ncbi:sensor histidine kinase [Kitasatospora sp. GP82]|uniref:sensor histidine kinase n=1 Tax=Kitasatospora sp. GP82 TaxID=3035089 RepID=UPI002473010B|nr:sensor histidine kinase [Kitasatospora sp. GP82]MDH6125267.1 signal transduction histidine kinase [Kitasatospora sp. GP82]
MISAFRRVPAWGAEHVPWSAATRRDAVFIAAGVPLGLPLVLALITPKLGVLFPLAVLCLDLLTITQRSRFRELRGLEIPGRAAPDARWLVRLRSGLTWRQAAYHLLAAPALAVGSLLVLSAWGVGLVMATVYAWASLMPRGSSLRSGIGWSVTDAGVSAVGLVLLLALPWLVSWLARLDERAARSLLGPNRAEVLERRVEDLAESRAGVVDAADAERRRIERDLHDGAQQRLVSLAMNLGLARRTLKGIPPEAMQVIVEAHQEAQAAIAELRDLVRGLHPVVLEDRGLDAALSGIAARAPVPVRLTVDLPNRIDPTVEAVAYFTVSEALANVAKHARASRVDLSVCQQSGRLRIVITDDGVGGADPSRGTGLIGLRKRAASVDGTLAITSPVGGPTNITVELPCEL